jgi:1D-myo-inositol-tetrakisphosphate 5-kinase/inositol-polyphosphate multikinase
VLDLVDTQLEQLEAVLAKLEIRFVGASVLIVYEADVARLEAALERWDAKVPKFVSDQVDADGEMDDDEDLGMSDLSDEDSDDDNDNDNDDDDDDGRKEDERLARKTPPVRVKMIDFAHTWLAQGEGPDQGVLLGFKTLRGLIRARKAEIMAVGKA